MKKFITTIILACSLANIFAQQNGIGSQNPDLDEHVFDVITTIFVIMLFMVFFLSIFKRVLENRLKNRIVDKGLPEGIVATLLQPKAEEDQHINIKWFALLAGLGAGLTIIHYTLPLGIHSLAIISFCLALSFLGYFFYLKQQADNL